MKKKLLKILEKEGLNSIKRQASDGSMPPSHNGPWRNKDSSVRTTSHYAILWCKLYQYTAKKTYHTAALKAGFYLLSNKSRPTKKLFYCRSDGRDVTNGLIGQAWAIEALVELYKVTHKKKFITLAKKIFLMHKFDKQKRLWNSCNLDGKSVTINETFNQQIWFAAMGANIIDTYRKTKKISESISIFISNLNQLMKVHSNGLIIHNINANSNLKKIINNYLFRKIHIPALGNNVNLKYVENGYHSFNLYGFAILKNTKEYCQIEFWKSKKFQKAIAYIDTNEYYDNIRDNIFSFKYNPSGTENAYAILTFFKDSRNIKKAKDWIKKQIKNREIKDNKADSELEHARIYELCRLYEVMPDE
jgi:hypothetical protein